MVAIAAATLVAVIATGSAGPRRVLVLPVDGNASAAQRSSVNAAVAKLARTGIAGEITVGDATYGETAAAVGCSPDQAACAQTVLATLAVDEVVYGQANTENGITTVTVVRTARGGAPRSQSAVIAEADGAGRTEAAMQPLFGTRASTSAGAVTAGAGAGSGSNVDAIGSASDTPRASVFDTRERKIALGTGIGGSVALIAGLAMWASQSSIQGQIDNHPTSTLADLRALASLEDRAASRALWGNVLVAVGLGLGAATGYYIHKDRQNRRAAIVPADSGAGAAVMYGGAW